MLKLQAFRASVVDGAAKTDLATTFKQHIMFAHQRFLAPLDADETAIGTGIDQIETVTAPFDPGMLAGDAAIIDDDAATGITTGRQYRILQADQIGLAQVARAIARMTLS